MGLYFFTAIIAVAIVVIYKIKLRLQRSDYRHQIAREVRHEIGDIFIRIDALDYTKLDTLEIGKCNIRDTGFLYELVVEEKLLDSTIFNMYIYNEWNMNRIGKIKFEKFKDGNIEFLKKLKEPLEELLWK